MEIWKDIKGYEGKYQVSNYGNVKSLNYRRTKTEKVLKPWDAGRGYLQVVFTRKKYAIHRLVAETFISNPNHYSDVNHIDGNKKNNHVDNLEWCTRKHNIQHAWKLGLSKPYMRNSNYLL